MRFRPANIRLINRRSNLLRLLLALSSRNEKARQNNPTDLQRLTGSLHISLSDRMHSYFWLWWFPHPFPQKAREWMGHEKVLLQSVRDQG